MIMNIITRIARRMLLTLAETAINFCNYLQPDAEDFKKEHLRQEFTAEGGTDFTVTQLVQWIRHHGLKQCGFSFPGVHVQILLIAPAAQALATDPRVGKDTRYPDQAFTEPVFDTKTTTQMSCNAKQKQPPSSNS